MSATVPFLIGGRLESSASDRRGDVFNPSTGKVQASIFLAFRLCRRGEGHLWGTIERASRERERCRDWKGPGSEQARTHDVRAR